jgi:hypothetical protein
MIAALIALYWAGMMMMMALIHAAKGGNVRKRIVLLSIFFWPFVIVSCYVMAAIEMIYEEWKDR